MRSRGTLDELIWRTWLGGPVWGAKRGDRAKEREEEPERVRGAVGLRVGMESRGMPRPSGAFEVDMAAMIQRLQVELK